MKDKKTLLLVACLFAAILLAAGLGYRYFSETYTPADKTPDGSAQEQEQLLFAAPPFTVKNMEGEVVEISDYEGKPWVIQFWATWCHNCISGFPGMQEIYEKYNGEINFLFVNMVDGVAEFEEDGRAFIEENGYTLPVVFDYELSAAAAWAPPGMPATVFVNAEGYVCDAVSGAMSTNSYEAFFVKHGFVEAPETAE